MNVQHIKLNIIPGGVLPVVHVSQYDHNAGGLVFDIYNGGEVYELPEGTTASIEGTKPDEYGFLYPAADVSGHSVTIDIMEQMTVVPGKVICELRLAHQQDNVGTINFILAVEPAGLSDDTEVSETDIPLLREAIEAGQRALQSAEQAELSADRAEEEADRAEEAADNLTAIRTSVPGEVVEVGDAKAGPLQQFRADFEPLQDLHGYERPWSGGTGVNLIDDNVRVSNSTDTAITVGQDVGYGSQNVSLAAGTYTFSAVYRNGATSRGYMRKAGETGSTMLWDVGNDHGTFTLADDTMCSFWLYNAAGLTSADVNAQIEAGAEATEYTPYANICPIEGTTGPVNATRTGKNLIDPTGLIRGSVFTANTDGSYTFTKTAQSSSGRITNICDCLVKAGQTVTFSADITGEPTSGNPIHFDLTATTTGSVRGSVTCTVSGGKIIGTVAPTEDTVGARLYWQNNATGIDDSVILRNIQVEYGETATEYDGDLQVDTYAITIPSEAGTVYGGTLTVNSDGSGQLVVDRGTINFGALNWQYATRGYFTGSNGTLENIIKKPTGATVLDGILCSAYAEDTSSHVYYGTYDNVVAVRNNTGSIWVRDTSKGTDPAAFKTATASVQLVYPLASPIAYPLTGAQVIQMLQGSNTIWMDVDGQIQITYITASQLSGIVEELDELQADVAEMQPVVEDLQTNAVKKSDIVQTGTVTTAGQYVVDARQLNPDLAGTIAKRITDLETDAAADVKKADITRATNVTATGTMVVDAYELNPSKTGTLAKKIADAATAASAAQTTANTANTAAGNANTALGGFSFGYTSDNKPGYKQPGADTVVPFSTGGVEVIAEVANVTAGTSTPVTLATGVDLSEYRFIGLQGVTNTNQHGDCVFTLNVGASLHVSRQIGWYMENGMSDPRVAGNRYSMFFSVSSSETNADITIQAVNKIGAYQVFAQSITLYGIR